MKLLFDQNISHRIVSLLQGKFAGSVQVRQVGLENVTDNQIFEFAKTNHYSIVTFDSDFVDLSVLKGTPPKIIWLRKGNLSTKSVFETLEKNSLMIENFLEMDDAMILEIF